MNYGKIFQEHINSIKSENRYRDFTQIHRECRQFPNATVTVDGKLKDIVIWSSNDSLCMGENKDVVSSMQNILIQEGGGSSGSRNLSGTTPHHFALEQQMADLHSKQSGLLFTSAYVANVATLSTISKIIPEIIFFSDENNHASIIDGIVSSKSNKVIFKHNDPADLEFHLKKLPVSQPKLIVFESIYSMDGDISPIKEICNLAEKYNAMTYVDEIHAVGMYGEQGSGMSSLLKQSERIDIIQGGFSKGYGLIGGYIAGEKYLVDCIRSSAPAFIFTTSLPSMLVGGLLSSVKHLRYSDVERKKLKSNVLYIKEEFEKRGIPFLKNETHIIPIIIGDGNLAKKISRELLKSKGLYLQAVNYPSVPKGTERFRLMVTAKHTKKEINDMISALLEVLGKYSILLSNNPMPENLIASL
ncbi:MAG: 5-aminolevulinate synthase [Alphaproteobacteria bacterium]|nr:5-aminolevulinate synthase [Alphaproteobacteria bacterium]